MSRSLVRLRELIGEGVGTLDPAASGGDEPSDPFFGLDALDELLPRGLRRSLHLFEGERAADLGALCGFVVSVLCRLQSGGRCVLWIAHPLVGAEGGIPYAPGLREMGLDPGTCLFVHARRSSEVLWAMEEGLRSRALAAVVGEVPREPKALGLTATRRLALRSERAGVPAYLIAAVGPGTGATAARTHWRIAAAPSRDEAAAAAFLLGTPTWTLELLKNRDGPCARRVVGFAPRRGRYLTPAIPCRASSARQAPPSRPPSPDVVPFVRPRAGRSEGR